MFLWHSFYAPNHQGYRGEYGSYRWFLGLSLDDKVPHFTTYGKNYSRRFQNKELLAHIFSHVLHQVLEAGLIDPSEIFIDGTHIKAAANNHKYKNVVVNQKAKFMSEQLDIEIHLDRKKHAKKFLKPAKKGEAKPKKQSTTDPDSGWFHKREHKEVFAYNAQVACDKHGWTLAYTVEAGNIHDSQAFPAWAYFDMFKYQKIGKNDGWKDLVFYPNTSILLDYGRIKCEFKSKSPVRTGGLLFG